MDLGQKDIAKNDLNICFNDIIKNHSGIFYKIARIYFKHPSDQEDVIQEMRLQIWKSLKKYNSQYVLSTWLYRICLNTAISMLRKHGKKKEIQTIQIDEGLHLAEDDKENAEYIQQLMIFISELRDIDKAIMLLYLEDKSHVEISDIVGISVSNVSTKIGRIKIKLKERFNNLKIYNNE